MGLKIYSFFFPITVTLEDFISYIFVWLFETSYKTIYLVYMFIYTYVYLYFGQDTNI